MSGNGRKHLSTAEINQVIDETIWKEKIAHEKKAKEYWDNIYRADTALPKVEIEKKNLQPISYFDTTVKIITSRDIGSRQQTPEVYRLQSSHGHRLVKSDLICSD